MPENSTKNSFQDHRLRIDGKTPLRHQRSKSESSVHSFQDHSGNLHGDKKSGNLHGDKTTGKSVLSRPSTKCAKNGPKSGSSKAIEPQWIIVDNIPPWTVIHTVHKPPWTISLLSRPFREEKCGLYVKTRRQMTEETMTDSSPSSS